MKVVFVGPSLARAGKRAGQDLLIRPPARQGDVMQAVQDGAKVIGLIDGLFELVAPVWHKEILFALSKGVTVFGAASLGALRAAECAAFGMRGVGRIYEDYAAGRRIDDADVALLHGPGELGYPAVTVPLVNVDATLHQASVEGLLSQAESAALHAAARSIFFKQRTWTAVCDLAGTDWSEISRTIDLAWVDQKQLDAFLLLEKVHEAVPTRAPDCEWSFNATPLWRSLYGES